MSVQLLDKTRKINKLLHNNNSSKVVFNDICDVLKDILNSNILVISKKGKVLGTGLTDGVEEIRELIVDEVGGFIDPLLNERLLGILSTKENVNLETLGFVNDIKKYTAIITPIDIAGERLGTLFVYRENDTALTDVTPDIADAMVESLVVDVYESSVGILPVALIAMVWSAAKGVMALMRGLNAVNGVDEKRNYFVIRFIASFYTLIMLGLSCGRNSEKTVARRL